MTTVPTKEITSLYEQVTQWASEQGWTITSDFPFDTRSYMQETSDKTALRIDTPKGYVALEPAGQRRDGRLVVHFYAFPSMVRVRLLQSIKSQSWQVVTDEGIPFHYEWNKENFVRLIDDLQQLP